MLRVVGVVELHPFTGKVQFHLTGMRCVTEFNGRPSKLGDVRLGVLDVGSNTVHLLVVDARRGGHPTPMSSTKASLRLAEAIDGSGKLTRKGADKLISTIDEFAKIAASSGCAELMAFATSAVRDATNSEDVLARVLAETGVALQVLSRGRRVPADVPGGAPVVRLERRAHHQHRHRRRLA